MTFFRQTIALLTLMAPLGASMAETLEEAWSKALASDQSLQAVRTQTTVARAQLAAAQSNRLPILKIDSAFTQLDDTPTVDVTQFGLSSTTILPGVVANDNFTTASATLSIPLYTSGLISSGIEAADAALGATIEREAAFIEDVKLSVAEAFVSVLRAGRAVDVADANVASLEAHVTDVTNMFRKGLVPQNDRLAVEVSLANAKQSALQVSTALDVATASYNQHLGRELEQPVLLDEIMPAVDPAAMSQDLDTLTTVALTTRTELTGLLNQSSALRHQSDSVNATTKPQIGASAGVIYFENELLEDDTTASASIALTWTLFDGGRTRHQASALERKARALREEHANLKTLIQLQVRTTWLAINETRQRLSVTEQAVAQSEENLRVASNRYRNGLGNNADVLDAETLRAITQSNHNNGRYDAAMARLRLARALGVL